MKPRGRTEVGSATIWVVIAIAIVTVVGGISAEVGVVTLQRHRASAAADAAALAAALASIEGSVSACHDAALVAAKDGAVVVSCQLLGAVSEVTVRVQLPGPLRSLGAAIAHARAGPATGTNRTMAPG